MSATQIIDDSASGVLRLASSFGRDVHAALTWPARHALPRAGKGQRRVIDTLNEALRRSDAENRAKSRLVATVSHEIRTPTTGILGATGLLLETRQTAEQRGYAEAIDRSARALLALVDEILDFSKIEAGKVILDAQPFSLGTRAREAVELMEPLARGKGLVIASAIDPRLTRPMIGDAARIGQILLNLLSNAVKFTESGHVFMSVSLEEDAEPRAGKAARALIKVRDTGVGLSATELDRLFEDFAQARSSGAPRQRGTGLGLSISKRLARAMGGDVGAASAPGRGSLFTVGLPLRWAAENATALTARQEAAPPENRRASKGARVLLVEDNPINALLARRMIEKAGCRVIEASTGRAAIARARRARYGEEPPIDLVLMDIHLPDLDGFEVMRAIKELWPSREHRPLVLALTANAFPEDRQRCLDAGMDDYLVKPFGTTELDAMVRRWLT